MHEKNWWGCGSNASALSSSMKTSSWKIMKNAIVTAIRKEHILAYTSDDHNLYHTCFDLVKAVKAVKPPITGFDNVLSCQLSKGS